MHFHHHRRHEKFQITTQEGSVVGYRDTIRGRVPHSHKDGNVQVLVYSADKQWYLQADAKVDRHGHFTVPSVFGLPPSVHGFYVVAVAGVEKITTSPVANVPAGSIVSNTVYVLRTV